MHSRKEDAESGKRRGMSDYGGRQAVACHVHSVSTGCESEFYTPPEYLFTFYSVPVIKCSAQINKGQRVHSAAHSQGTVHHGAEARNLKLEAGGSHHSHIQEAESDDILALLSSLSPLTQYPMPCWKLGPPRWVGLLTWMNDIKTSLPQHTQGSIFQVIKNLRMNLTTVTNNHTFLLKMKEKWRPFQMKMETLHSQKKWLKGKNVRWSIGPTWETSSSQRMGGFRRRHVNQVCNPVLWKVREEDVYKPTVSWATQELEVSLTFS